MSKCPNCNEENWKNVDEQRFKDKDKNGKTINMCICQTCGFCTYPDKIADKEKMLEHYRKEYRPAPSINNSFTGQRKNHFHLHFLKDLLDEWKAAGKNKPVICDVGTAFGMSLNMFKQLIPEADLNGTELTETMRNVAYHEFGFKLSEEIDASKKYDLIMSYKVLEHQIDPLEELKKYAMLLSENGRLYISVPTWFKSLTNFGMDGFDLEYYYDPNHINVWTQEMFESLLSRAGFEIIKKDHIIYGDTYLCKVVSNINDSTALSFYKENPNDIELKMNKAKKAFLSFVDYKYDEAIEHWPDYPQAWVAKLEMNRKQMAEKGYLWFDENMIQPMLAACPTSAEVWICATDYAMRAKQFEKAIELANICLDKKPNNPATISQLINIFKELAVRQKDEAKKIDFFNKAKESAIVLHNVSSQNRDDAINQIYFISSLLPIPIGA